MGSYSFMGKEKQPYYIHPKEDDFFLIGGLYDVWSNPATGEMVNTFSIITTVANPLMAEIHNSKKRMPLIVEDRSLNAWQDNWTSEEVIQSIFKPFDGSGMNAYQISKQANNTRNNRNVPEILSPIDVFPNQGQLSLF